LASRLFESPAEQEAFLHALNRPGAERPALLWAGPPDPAWRARHVLPWPASCPRALNVGWIDFVAADAKPVADGLPAYPLDASSVWAAAPLLLPGFGPEPVVLDLCAAPGGKSVFAHRALEPALLLANEVVAKRLAILRHNLARLALPRIFTQRLDPSELAARAPGAFDVVLVDAPCSGQSLPAKGIPNPGCFHPAVVRGNARRQHRLLAAAAALVAPDGHLLYTTCTFAPEENEKAIAWFLARFPGFTPTEVPFLAPWRSPWAEGPAYRLHPHQGLGAGGFTCLLRRSGRGGRNPLREDLLAFPASQPGIRSSISANIA
jgi:16S rRNA C967 or C1407 C5-methylase (RsmB/RsmF family)